MHCVVATLDEYMQLDAILLNEVERELLDLTNVQKHMIYEISIPNSMH